MYLLFTLALASNSQLGFAAPCDYAELTKPSASAVVLAVRPDIAWQVVSEANEYRVEIESRVAEGSVLVSIDTRVTGASFRPPQLLTDSRAVIKVRVTTGCPPDDGRQLRAQSATFFVDTSPLCPGPSRIDTGEGRRSIEWGPTPGATRYHVTLLRPDGTQIAKGQTQRPEFAVRPSDDPLIAVVRPYCSTGFGPYASALISTGKP